MPACNLYIYIYILSCTVCSTVFRMYCSELCVVLCLQMHCTVQFRREVNEAIKRPS